MKSSWMGYMLVAAVLHGIGIVSLIISCHHNPALFELGILELGQVLVANTGLHGYFWTWLQGIDFGQFGYLLVALFLVVPVLVWSMEVSTLKRVSILRSFAQGYSMVLLARRSPYRADDWYTDTTKYMLAVQSLVQDMIDNSNVNRITRTARSRLLAVLNS